MRHRCEDARAVKIPFPWLPRTASEQELQGVCPRQQKHHSLLGPTGLPQQSMEGVCGALPVPPARGESRHGPQCQQPLQPCSSRCFPSPHRGTPRNQSQNLPHLLPEGCCSPRAHSLPFPSSSSSSLSATEEGSKAINLSPVNPFSFAGEFSSELGRAEQWQRRAPGTSKCFPSSLPTAFAHPNLLLPGKVPPQPKTPPQMQRGARSAFIITSNTECGETEQRGQDL